MLETELLRRLFTVNCRPVSKVVAAHSGTYVQLDKLFCTWPFLLHTKSWKLTPKADMSVEVEGPCQTVHIRVSGCTVPDKKAVTTLLTLNNVYRTYLMPNTASSP